MPDAGPPERRETRSGRPRRFSRLSHVPQPPHEAVAGQGQDVTPGGSKIVTSIGSVQHLLHRRATIRAHPITPRRLMCAGSYHSSNAARPNAFIMKIALPGTEIRRPLWAAEHG